MSRSNGNVAPAGDILAIGFPTILDPDIASAPFVIPPVVPNVKRQMKVGEPDIPQSNPMVNPPLYFNQIGNNPAELFQAPVEDFNVKIKPTLTSEAPITRERLTRAESQSRYASLFQPE